MNLDEILSLLRSKSNYRFTVKQVASSLHISTPRANYLLTQLVHKQKIEFTGTLPGSSDRNEDLSYQINKEGFFFIKRGGFLRAFRRKWWKLTF
ncbi:MAG: hypothetical protein AAF632_03535 [Bacteroidota bacterium]